MNAIPATIKEELDKAGTLSFARLMALALYAEHGYYTESVRIGKAGGDFYTASQSELFAMTLARCIERQAKEWGNPPVLQIVEIGGGQGELAVGIGQALGATSFAGNVRYHIQERSAYLQKIQQEQIAAHFDASESEWDTGAVLFSWSAPDKSVPSIIIANEVLDALPVERIRRTAAGWDYLQARQKGEELEWVWVNAPDAVAQLADAFVQCPVGMEAEVSLEYEDLIISVLGGYRAPALALWFDYGITRDEWQTGIRPQGTLRAYRRHQLVSPFESLTEADITADVNWTQVESMIRKAGVTSVQLVSQGKFLLDNGILELTMERQQAEQDLVRGSRWVAQFKQLALPEGMGDRFSVMVCRQNP